jgi:hypothetical protein
VLLSPVEVSLAAIQTIQLFLYFLCFFSLSNFMDIIIYHVLGVFVVVDILRGIISDIWNIYGVSL